MTRIRRPAVAGLFYPDDPRELAAQVERHLAAARRAPHPHAAPVPLALVAPHAGYLYSGPVAGSAFAALGDSAWVRRVLLLGPSHYVPFAGLALPDADAFATPLGEVPPPEHAATPKATTPEQRTDARRRRMGSLYPEDA